MGKSKLTVSTEKAERIRNICSRHTGQDSVAAIKDDLLKFIDTDLKKRFFDPGLKAGIGEVAFEKKKDQYELYRDSVATRSAKSIERALSEEGVSRGAINLIEVFDLYIAEYDPIPEPPSSAQPLKLQAAPGGFSEQTIDLLKARAISRCSFEECPNPTSGPVMRNNALALHLGQAVAIYGVHPGQPRYDASKPQKEDDISNAIWLCTYHAAMVNEHDGKDYPAATLLKWKRAHEQLMNAWVQGRKRPFLRLNINEIEPELATEIISFFSQQSLLFKVLTIADKPVLYEFTENAKSFFQSKLYDIQDNDKIMQQVYIIELGMGIFLADFMSTDDNETFEAGYAALKKLIVKVLAEMAAINKIKLPSNLQKIAPK